MAHHLLLRALCDELARCGVKLACTSPGSRNTPILQALLREARICCFSHIDERSAGFFALGAAKASGLPAVVSCTSGTAAANLMPAVIEAREARVPLIVLSADRPPELRDVGAGQTIDQVKLYGSAVKWFCELDLGEATPERGRWIRQVACRAFWTAAQDRPGPVHLNVPLREPLVSEEELPEDPQPGRPDGRPWVIRRPARPAPAEGSAGGGSDVALPARGVVIAGRHERPDALGAELAGFAAEAGYPLLADPLSGARHGPAAISRYDLLLREEGWVERMRPDVVLRLGDLPTSKPLRQWLAALDGVPQIALDPEAAWQDPMAAAGEVEGGDPLLTLRRWRPSTPRDPAWLADWRAADDALAAELQRVLDAEEKLSEPLVAQRLPGWLPAEATLFVASSMPIRDIELHAPAAEVAPRMLANRGANGIDGTVSTAFGVAATGADPVVLLIGDVALAHDIGGLLSARRLGLALTIVLLHNDGGGIFHFLPVAEQQDVFAEHVSTPHGLDFAQAAALYGCNYLEAQTEDELEAAVKRSVGSPGVEIITVRTNREANLALHRRLAERALAELKVPAAGPSPGA